MKQFLLSSRKADDPRIGSQPKICPGLVNALQSATKPGVRGGVLVVYLGTCDSCILKYFDPKSLAKSTFNSGNIVVLFGEHVRTELKAELASLGIKCFVDLSAEQSLNSYFVPRAYILNTNGTLLALQHEGELILDFINNHSPNKS